MLKAILKTMKINHYLKNLLVFAPIIFSKNFYNSDWLYRSILIFFAFCFISSAAYIFNDIVDKNLDKKHPTKCNRPIACNKLPVSAAAAVLIVLVLLSLYITHYLGFTAVLIIISYFILNIFYSLKLKNIPFIDVICIAFGFILRIFAGCSVIKTVSSLSLILLTFFVSMFFTFSKRKLELKLPGNCEDYRISLKYYNKNLINNFILINMILSVFFYFIFMTNIQALHNIRTNNLYFTIIPFTLILCRIKLLLNNAKNEDLIVFFEKDLILITLFLSYFIVLFFTFIY